MEAFGARVARARPLRGVVYLQGDLGAGKTTLVRGLLRALGVEGVLRSPTYTLVEPYCVDGERIFHFDLYRLADAEELEFIGARDYFAQAALWMIEWPERGAGFIPEPDLSIHIGYAGEGRRLAYRCRTAQGAVLAAHIVEISSGVE